MKLNVANREMCSSAADTMTSTDTSLQRSVQSACDIQMAAVSTAPCTAHPSNKQAMDYLTQNKETLRGFFPAREEILREAKAQTQRQRRLKNTASAAVAVLVLATAWAIDPVLQRQDMHTDIGQQAIWHMPDGSQMALNTNSRVQAESRLHSRRVSLLQGEALFKVAHGWRPFTVATQHTDILDIGTVFNVRNTNNGAMVSVLQGAVEVSNGGAKQVLLQNQTLLSSARGLGRPTLVDTSARTAWQQGKLFFDATPLSAAVDEMQRYRQAAILIKDDKAAKLRISGAYDLAGIESLLDMLPMSVAVKVSRQPDGTVTITSR